MKAEFTWRKTAAYYTLLRWSNVLMKAELPYEYVNVSGPKFWYVPPVVVDKVAYIEHIRLGIEDKPKLIVSSVLTGKQYNEVMEYLQEAGKRLSEIKKEIEDGVELVIQV